MLKQETKGTAASKRGTEGRGTSGAFYTILHTTENEGDEECDGVKNWWRGGYGQVNRSWCESTDR